MIEPAVATRAELHFNCSKGSRIATVPVNQCVSTRTMPVPSIIGEEEFSLLFHKGKSENINFTKIMDDFLLVSIFGNDVSLGYLRLKIDEVIKKVKALIEQTRST